MKKTMAGCISFVSSLVLLCGLFSATFSASALTLGKVADFEGYENGADLVAGGVFSYAAEDISITADTSVHADGTVSARFDADPSAQGGMKCAVLPVPAGIFDGASALIFYLKAPAAQRQQKTLTSL